MLRVARISDRTGRYYLADLASELDVRSLRIDDGVPGRTGGRWLGTGAAGLALRGLVEPAPLAALLSGSHPSEGHRLRQRQTAVSAYDLTFAAPKSVSIVFVLASPDAAAAVRAAHEDAVDAAMRYVGAHAAALRRMDPTGRSTSPAEGLVAASFTHGLSRALDPHLHSHVLVANLARGDDSRWRALDGRGLYAHAQAAGALYDAVLRHGVTTRLGLSWEPKDPRGCELAVVDPLLIGAFSARRAEILTDLHGRTHRKAGTAWASGMDGGTRSSPSRRAHALAWAATRDPKAPSRPLSELRGRWAAIARDVGGSMDLVADAPRRRARHQSASGQERAGHADLDEHRFAAAIYETGRQGVARRDALGAWTGALRTGAPGQAIARCVDALRDWGAGNGVAETRYAPATVVPPPHVLRVLGPRPASPERLSVWLSASSSIDRYRARWEVRDRWRALGPETRVELAAMPARRLAEHLSTSRAIDEALSALGRRRERERDRRLDGVRSLARDGP